MLYFQLDEIILNSARKSNVTKIQNYVHLAQVKGNMFGSEDDIYKAVTDGDPKVFVTDEDVKFACVALKADAFVEAAIDPVNDLYDVKDKKDGDVKDEQAGDVKENHVSCDPDVEIVGVKEVIVISDDDSDPFSGDMPPIKRSKKTDNSSVRGKFYGVLDEAIEDEDE